MDFSQRHLTGHSWTYLRDFQKRRIFFFEKLPPCTAKTVFENPKGPPFGCWKKKFFESSFYQSHVVAFVLTIPKWYNTWVLQIFFVNIWSKIFFKIFFSNLKKTSFPYFGVKLSCVCLMIAYRKKLPKVTQRWPNVTLRWPNVTLMWVIVALR